jgi:uncharacterized protein (DUF1697 family)
MSGYVAFLRGMNVGGHRISNDELRARFEELTARARKEVLRMASDEDRLAFGERELLWLPSGGILDTALDFKSIGRLLGPTTTRTKGTVEQLAAKYFADE